MSAKATIVGLNVPSNRIPTNRQWHGHMECRRVAVFALLCAFIVTPARAALSFVQNFGSAGSGSGQFNGPVGVAVDSAGNVYVADISNNRIDRFNPANFAGTFTSFGSHGSGSGQFSSPTGVTVDSAGNVYVADAVQPPDRPFQSGELRGHLHLLRQFVRVRQRAV